MLTKQRHKNTCFCRRVRKYEELLFMCTLGIYILRGQLYDTSRSCPSICLRTAFSPSSLTEGRLQTSRQKHCFSKGGTWRNPACLSCLQKYIWGCQKVLVASPILVPHALSTAKCFVCLFVFFSVEVTEECCLLSCPFTFWRLF